MLSHQLSGNLQGQSSLADSAGAVEGEQAGRSEEPFDLLDLALTSNEAREGRGEIVARPARLSGELAKRDDRPAIRIGALGVVLRWGPCPARHPCSAWQTVQPTLDRAVRLWPRGRALGPSTGRARARGAIVGHRSTHDPLSSVGGCIMEAFICRTCGVQYAPSEQPPA